MAAVPHSIRTPVRLWLPVCSVGFLSDWPRTERVPNGPASYADASRGYCRLPLSHYPRRSDRAPADAYRWCHFDGWCRCGFASTSNFLLLILAGTIGVISPSGNEVGPFLSIEQAALSHV